MGLPVQCLLLALALHTVVSLGPETDEITQLPGAPERLPFKQYSGYATVNATNGRNLFYWFTESQSSPGQDPLVLWLNGGPGCSSLGALMAEHGPFQPNKDGTLRMNDYAWNKVANMIYLESPSGVGFSYSNTPSDYAKPGDATTAADVVTFLVQFLVAYPHLQGREFYVSGESYGGHYVPTTAKAIVEHNAAATPADAINLKGILIGNAWTVAGEDNLGVVQTWLGYNLIQAATGADVLKHCNLSNLLPIVQLQPAAAQPSDVVSVADADDDLCKQALDKAGAEIGNVDPYDIYELICAEGESSRLRAAFLSKMAESTAPLRHHARNVLGRMAAADPCEMEYAQDYLNLKAVQSAAHAKPTRWSECNMAINGNYSRVDFLASMLPVHAFLLKHDVRIVVYSGDIDGIVPTHGSRNWIAKLVAMGTVTVSKPWTPWTDSQSQMGGYVTRYGTHYSLITVHGAGHMVPATQPLRALDVFTKFLKALV